MFRVGFGIVGVWFAAPFIAEAYTLLTHVAETLANIPGIIK